MSRLRRLVVPQSVTIRGRRWRVYDEDELPAKWEERMQGKTMNAHGVVGMAHPSDREIHLAREIKPGSGDQRELTFVHELMHAILAERDVRLPCDYEERVVASLERPLYDALRRLQWV